MNSNLNQIVMLAHIHGSVSQADIRKVEAFRKVSWQVIQTVMEGKTLKEAILQQDTDTMDTV